MASTIAEIISGSVFPRVENPLPESIGIGFPFALAGAAGVFASVIFTHASSTKRNRAIRVGGQIGFWIGVAIYFLALAVQVGSAQ